MIRSERDVEQSITIGGIFQLGLAAVDDAAVYLNIRAARVLLDLPEGLSRYNIVPGLIGTILTMTMVMLTSLAMTRERERGTMENLLAFPVHPLEVMIDFNLLSAGLN